MDPEDIPTGFPYAQGGAYAHGDAEDENERMQAALSCGPQCASSVLATRYAKILRQERLLQMAASSLDDLEVILSGPALPTEQQIQNRIAARERAAAIRRQIDEERKNPA